jgi:glycosyltransferase involved in cell wall biosynthesis
MSISDQNTSRISVLLVTYNHENYIRQALDSLFGQLIDEPIELIVADDASSDSTSDIIKEYDGKDARFRFRYLDNTINLGITKNYQRGFAACSSEYVAVLEGDDYWINPFKLQRQVDFLDTHWECDLCAVNYIVYEEYHYQMTPRTSVGFGHRLFTARENIMDNIASNFSTSMYRKSALDELPDALFDLRSYDWIVNICVAKKSMIGFLEEPMSVYRLHLKGAWSQMSYVEKLKKQLELIPAYDALTNHVYHSEFELLSNNIRHYIYTNTLTNIAAQSIKSTDGLLSRVNDYLPPLLISIVRSIIPPKLQCFISRILHRGAI